MDNDNIEIQLKYFKLKLKQIEFEFDDNLQHDDLLKLYKKLNNQLQEFQNITTAPDDIFYDRHEYCNLILDYIVLRHEIHDKLLTFFK